MYQKLIYIIYHNILIYYAVKCDVYIQHIFLLLLNNVIKQVYYSFCCNKKRGKSSKPCFSSNVIIKKAYINHTNTCDQDGISKCFISII